MIPRTFERWGGLITLLTVCLMCSFFVVSSSAGEPSVPFVSLFDTGGDVSIGTDEFLTVEQPSYATITKEDREAAKRSLDNWRKESGIFSVEEKVSLVPAQHIVSYRTNDFDTAADPPPVMEHHSPVQKGSYVTTTCQTGRGVSLSGGGGPLRRLFGRRSSGRRLFGGRLLGGC